MSSKINVAPALTKQNLVESQINGVNVIVNDSQGRPLQQIHTFVKYTLTPSASTSILQSSGGKVTLNIPKSSMDKAVDACLYLTLNIAGTVAPIDAFHFIDRIEFRAQGGSGDLIQTLYDDQLYASLAFMARERYDSLRNDLNLNQFYNPSETLYNGQTRTYAIPLIGSWIQNVQPHVNQLAGDIVMNVFFVSGGVLVSGTSTNMTLASVDLIVNQEKHTNERLAQELDVFINKAPLVSRFLDCVTVNQVGTITASTQYKVSLENLNGRCSHLFFFIRSGSTQSASSNGYLTLADPCEAGTIDLLSPTNQSLLGNGSPLPWNHFRRYCASNFFPSDIFRYKPIGFISFCDNPALAYKGVDDGGFEFNGSKYQLAITPAGSATSEVHTVTLTNSANGTGYYNLAIGGDVTDSLIYSTSAANMKVALDALPCLNKRGITSTFSGTAAATFTVTFSKPVANEIGLVRIIPTSLAQSTTPEVGVSSLSTAGVEGWTTGTYSVDVYAMMHEHLVVNNGIISIH